MSHSRYGEPSTSPSPEEGESRQLTPAELQRAVHEADPAAFLVLPRVLRRVVKHDRRLTGFAAKLSHPQSYVVGRESLLDVVEPDELGGTGGAAGLSNSADSTVAADLPERVILLASPSPQQFDETPADDLLVRCWRLLFHARVHLVLGEAAAKGQLGPAGVRRRIHAIGEIAFDEIREVLDREDLLFPPRDDEAIYIEFAATYLELRRFAPSFLPRFFPGLTDLNAVDALIGEDVDAERLYRESRLAGAPDPRDVCILDPWTDPTPESATPEESLPAADAASATKCRFLMRKARRPAALGNTVRAAIFHARAERSAPLELAATAKAAIEDDVSHLAGRLLTALDMEVSRLPWWRESLAALVAQTPRGVWTVEARLLYDLQKVCIDRERDVFKVDLVGWALSRGRRPVKRRLPHQREVLLLKHLRSAGRRLAAARISDAQRRRLARLLREASDGIERHLRPRFRAILTASLDEVGLAPHNPPERAAQKKLVEELLDAIVEHGFLSMGDLRDAISRNQLKLPDLAGMVGFLAGDELLRLNEKLAVSLEGVYRPGEFYRRWMQRLSSLAFGTAIGRFFTRFAAVPFGGAYVVLAGVHEISHFFHRAPHVPEHADKLAGAAHPAPLHLTSPSIVFAVGLFLLFLVNSAAFRRVVGRFFKMAFRVVRAVVIEPLCWLVRSSLLQRFFHSRPVVLTWRFAVKPLLWTALVWFLFPLRRADPLASAELGFVIFLLFNLLLNSRVGRNMEEVSADWLVEGWHRFGLRLIVGLFWFCVDLFKRFTEGVERLTYSVDEWLRFRAGEGRFSLAFKAVLGLGWACAAYVLRFAVTVLIEPQINPIKHFPVVTVAHKLLFAAYAPFTKLIAISFRLGLIEAGAIATTIIWCIPGVFGFLVWELKENWRLYAANRRRLLGPVVIGPHGETMARLLKPGFHSGVVPKRFAKLRKAERLAWSDGGWPAVHKQLHVLERLALGIRRYVERDFLEWLAESPEFRATPIALDRLHLATNCIRLDFGHSGTTSPLAIAIEAEAGRIIAGVRDAGWASDLSAHRRETLSLAIIGLYKSAGVDLVRQQIEGEFPPPMPCYDVTPAGLAVWPDESLEVEVLYDLGEEQWIAPRSVRGLARRRLPTLDRQRLLFADDSVSWPTWIEAWTAIADGRAVPLNAVAVARVLPS